MRVVVDASVIVTWILPDAEREAHTDEALALLRGVRNGSVQAVQPPHWLAEVAAVLVRLRPEIAEATLDLLDALELPMAADIAIYRRAARLAAELDHHLFDTLYHAVALDSGAVLITADTHYFPQSGSRRLDCGPRNMERVGFLRRVTGARTASLWSLRFVISRSSVQFRSSAPIESMTCEIAH